mmetsp:Transcript_71466/g.206909  ORF Transcript_71466/g.206909 Transcript_71466/m.206909 type:complete len:1607 (-) Transcript_71466:95-4915(-)|eukprot:CAMPEP_0176010098 /NCGR_PEP_ID=MMETSP0120_2-20121206/4588_1 /TAXON_ID=160619 /ORGANISM="Kryptoperidinium foliaceum, Strain CCMP 1326" /LENGTH=1606 /DNA_ID=CAMNT_0017342909 /DNA_START=112 /DNA_END=4932 /DNA_ORIENTATION=-
MRWPTSRGNSEDGAAAPLDASVKPENEHHHQAAPTSSSPLVQLEDAESALAASALDASISNNNATSNSSPRQAIDPSSESSSASQADPDGDPPYKRSQQSTSSNSNSNRKDGESNDEEDMPALEAVNPDDGDDDDDTGDDQEVPWKPQATQSTCEFTHTITNYSQKRDSGCKKAEYSATTVDEFGNRWRLIVYVNGNGRASNHHLSLFLQVADADDLPFGWKKAVSYVLTLEHPSGPNLSYAKRNPDKTFKLCPKAIDWGWSQFITSDRIQQEGFVQDDSLIVRASVTVKSSSVSIDLEDAELYLKCAVEEGKPEAVQLCLDQGASVNCQFKDDLYTPLHTACSTSTGDEDDEEDDEDAEDDEDDDASDASNNRKRRHAPGASSGSMKVLQLLLEKGADGNACNKWRETPLLIAANNGHRSAVEALLKHGADPSLCSEAGWSALTFAAHKGYDDIVELLLKAGAPVNCLVTEDASTPLHKACAGSKPGHLAAVNLLLSNNADVHALNKWRETPLLTAANHGQAGAVEALLKAGADPCKCTDTGWSPLSIAAYKGHDDVVKLLLEEGAPTEEADPTLSALLQAATKGLPDTVELLLKHGADHTVTTKKGDTALSILVEQNLIDAAADMVTEYNASIPRCSRDRKKVQRARLLINLKIKQRQREGRDVKTVESDDDESDHDEGGAKAELAAQELTEKGNAAGNGQGGSKKKKKNKKKMSAEQQAKAAEEALLAELEMEDAERQKQEQEANKKSAKKRKKKERERQQKKEQEEKRLAEEREREEKLRKEREAKEAKERAERERILAIKRKEEEEERNRILELQKLEQKKRDEQRKKELEKQRQQQQKQQKQDSASVSSSSSADKKGKSAPQKTPKRQPVGAAPVASPRRPAAPAPRPAKATKPVAKAVGQPATKLAPRAAPKATGKNRGWETKAAPGPQESKQTPPKPIGAPSSRLASAPASSFVTPQRETPDSTELFSTQRNPSPFSFNSDIRGTPAAAPIGFNKSDQMMNGFAPLSLSGKSAEVPAVALFRRNKVSELLQRCAMGRTSSESLSSISEGTIKKVLYRWVARAAHETTGYLDCIIPSWTDYEKLVAFFQRQFISESRKGMKPMPSMESLKEAGSAIAGLCYNLAKEVAEFCDRVAEQLPPDWNDGVIGMKASDMMHNGASQQVSVLLDWANRAQVFLPAFVFSKLQDRYCGAPGRVLSTMFSTQIRYETLQLITSDTLMDFNLPADTLSVLSSKMQLSAEIWSNPMSTTSGVVFYGQFFDVDELFGGLAPFSKDDSSDENLVRHGGSVAAIVPLDNMVATQYLHRMVDVLDRAENTHAPLSFTVFLRSDCFLDGKSAPTFQDLCVLEPRLRDRGELAAHVRELPARQHGFFCTKTNSVEVSETGSLMVILQNVTGKRHYGISDQIVNEIVSSLSTGHNQAPAPPPQSGPALPLMSEMSFSAPEFVPAVNRSNLVGETGNSFFAPNQVQSSPQAPISPVPQQASNILPDFGAPIGGDFGGFGGGPIGSSLGSALGPRTSRPARGRLFDLVDDGAEDETADVVSGMLGNLNMDDLFSHQPNRNSNGEIDIEAISLMGIGGPAPSSSTTSGSLQPRRGPFGY